MLIQSINYKTKGIFISLLAVILFQNCELPPPREIYNPGFTLNKMEEFPLGWTYERGYPSSIKKVPIPNEKLFKPELTAEIENPVILSQKVVVRDSGSYFVIGKFRAEIEEGSFFISATGESFFKSIKFIKDINSCKRTFFSFTIDDHENVTLRIGFNQNSIGTAYPDTLFLYKEDYFDPISIDARAMRSGLENFAGIKKMSAETMDSNIDKIANVINIMYLSTDPDSTKEIRDFFGEDDFDTHQTAYLFDYVKNWDDKNNAYDQKISLTLDELLKLYRIPVRQLYLQDSCKAEHQFIEYYNQYDSRWKIIDAFYGVRYVGDSDKYLGVEEVENLLGTGLFSDSNIKKLDIRFYKYDAGEIIEQWNTLEPTIRIIKK